MPAKTHRMEVQGITQPAKGHVTADRYVILERWFKASPERVFKAWSDPKMLPKFFWPVGEGKVDKLDFRPGGQLLMSHTTQPWKAIWTFVEIVPNKKIVTRDIWPDGSGIEATGTLELIPENGGTRMKLRHGPFPTKGPYMPEGAAAGSAMVADRLAEELETPGPGEGFQIVRYFQAPTSKVYQMWTTKEGLAKWWALAAKDMGYAFKVNKLDVRVGGEYDLIMSNQEHGELHNHGKYLEVVPNKLLVQEWTFDIFLGPGEKPYPISVRIELEELDTMGPGSPKGTKMTFTQGPMAKPEFTEGSRQGVIANFAKLSAALAT
ncbi:MAG: SRPBCC family protein [Thermoplasmatota archaeon]